MRAWATLTMLALVATSACAGGWNPNSEGEAKQEAAVSTQSVDQAITAFRGTDPSMETFFNKAYGYAVFPSIGKGGLGIGGARGKGKLYEQGRIVGDTTLTQFTVGLQAGGQVYREIIFFKDKATIDHFKQGRFALSAQANAIAAAAGAAATAAYNEGVAVFTMGISGLMFEASVGGQKFNYTPML